jgi:DNA adenine methylase/adenine-specific DNA-methyltransferase
MQENIKSPLNYTGNKSRLIDQFAPHFPKKMNKFVDLCCGGASVGLNFLNRANEVFCFDINNYVIELLKTLQKFSYSKIENKSEVIINDYNMSNSYKNGYDAYKKYVIGNNGLKEYNRVGYLNLREHFNGNNLAVNNKSFYLFVLICYAFNNDIRFNSSGKFNMPVGKTDFNASIRGKLKSFKMGIHNKNITFKVSDFEVVTKMQLRQDDFVYVDPPYLITDAVYNKANADNYDGWSENSEKRLLDVLSYLNSKNIRFALSNILQRGNQKNSILNDWISQNSFNVFDIRYHYRSSSYNKKHRDTPVQEVLITNYATDSK